MLHVVLVCRGQYQTILTLLQANIYTFRTMTAKQQNDLFLDLYMYIYTYSHRMGSLNKEGMLVSFYDTNQRRAMIRVPCNVVANATSTTNKSAVCKDIIVISYLLSGV